MKTLFLLLILTLPQAARAQPATPPVLRAAAVQGEVRIDGRLDEAAWAAAPVSDAFTQSYPASGSPPSERTAVRVLYDASALYVGVRVHDSRPDSIAAQLARRDATGIYSDWVHVVIDSYADSRSAYRFAVNPRGVKRDVFHFDDVREDARWDAVWEVATTVDSSGWTAEFRIPFSQIRFDAAEPVGGRSWGFQVHRDIARRGERASWAPWDAAAPGYVSRFGRLVGLEGVRPGRRMEVQPYISSRLTRAPIEARGPFQGDSDVALGIGADLKVGLGGAWTATATVNPDFGQVEADPAEVNLSAFESFFPERRPFFMEGAEVFRFGGISSNHSWGFQQFFYSRRIGGAPQHRPDAPGAAYVEMPGQTPILGAGKITGRASGWSGGVMGALTGETGARYLGVDGAPGRMGVQPRTGYLVGRGRRDLRAGSTVLGGMLTGVHRDVGDPRYAPLYRSSALLGGVDFEHAWASRQWILTGYAAGSRIAGSASVMEAAQHSSARYFQRPDARTLRMDAGRSSLTGHMAEWALQRNGPWFGSVGYKEVSPGFEMNDLGFQNRSDYRSVAGAAGYQHARQAGIFRSWAAFAFGDRVWNFDGDLVSAGYGVGGQGQLTSTATGGATLHHAPESTSDRLTRGGPLGRVPARTSLSVFGATDARRPVVLDAGADLHRDVVGGAGMSLRTGLDFRPGTAARVRIGPSLSWLSATDQYVRSVADTAAHATFGRRYVFAELRQTTAAVEARVDWTFSPTLSLQLVAQPFVATGAYGGFKELPTPSSRDYSVYGRDVGTVARLEEGGHAFYRVSGVRAEPFEIGDPDFAFRSLRGNAVLRWEYRPGSSVFFIWQQQRQGFEGVGSFDLARDTGALFRAPATNIFLIKASYWLGR
jgi:hypothetical protein